MKAIEFCIEGAIKVGMLICHRKNAKEHNRPATLKTLLAAGAPVKQLKMTVRMWPIMNEPESVLLLYAAGFREFENRPLNLKMFVDNGLEVPEVFLHLDKKYRARKKVSDNSCTSSVVPTLFEVCREIIRDELIQHNTKNLFQVVDLLPLPKEVKEYLLYGASLSIKPEEEAGDQTVMEDHINRRSASGRDYYDRDHSKLRFKLKRIEHQLGLIKIDPRLLDPRFW